MANVLELQSTIGGAVILEHQGAAQDYIPNVTRLVWIQQESRIIWIGYENRVRPIAHEGRTANA